MKCRIKQEKSCTKREQCLGGKRRKINKSNKNKNPKKSRQQHVRKQMKNEQKKFCTMESKTHNCKKKK